MVVFASESITSWLSLPPPTPRPAPRTRRARDRVPGARRSALRPSLGARARAVLGLVGAPRRNARRRRDARELDPPPPRDEGRRPRGGAPRAARDVERARAPSRALGARDRLPRPRPARARSARSRRHGVALRSTRCPQTAFDHGAIVLAGRDRLRGKLSYSNIGFALAPETFTLAELRDVYEAALGYEVSVDEPQARARAARRDRVGRERRAHGLRAAGRPSSTASARGGSRSRISSPCSGRPP